MLRFPYCKFSGGGISQNLNDSRWSGKKGGEKCLLKSQRVNFEGISYFTISYSQKVVSEKKRIQSAEGAKSGVWEAFCPFRTAWEAVFLSWNQRKRGKPGIFWPIFSGFSSKADDENKSRNVFTGKKGGIRPLFERKKGRRVGFPGASGWKGNRQEEEFGEILRAKRKTTLRKNRTIFGFSSPLPPPVSSDSSGGAFFRTKKEARLTALTVNHAFLFSLCKKCFLSEGLKFWQAQWRM